MARIHRAEEAEECGLGDLRAGGGEEAWMWRLVGVEYRLGCSLESQARDVLRKGIYLSAFGVVGISVCTGSVVVLNIKSAGVR
jgi:hypothetical protein